MLSWIEDRCRSVDEGRLMAHCRAFARRVKLSGTAEERDNVGYLQRELDALGFATQLILHDAYISLPLRARVEAGGRALRSITHSFSRPSPPAGITAPLAYLGRGQDSDFADQDVAGRIVVLDGLAVPAAADRATRAGAAGQIHVSPYEHIHEMCISPVWGSPSDETLERLPKTVVSTVDRADGEFLKGLIAQGGARATLHAEVDTGWRKTPILIADLAIGGDGAPFVLLSGHQDTWYYGVMDNGSANAAMLEVARLAAEARPELQRGLRIAFWSGHSHGRYSGSAWYADEHWLELERRCVAHVNVDSLGGKGNTVLADAPASAELMHLARDAVRRASGETLTEQRMSRAGDQSFWGIGVPSIYMTLSHEPAGQGVNITAGFMGPGRKKAGGAMGWWWHTPEDTLDKLDPALLVRDTRVYVETTLRLLAEPVLPFDHRAQVRELKAVVRDLHASVGRGRDLGRLVAAVEQLAGLTERLHAAAARISSQGGPGDIARANAALVALSRVLTPLEYVKGDRFAHDPALGLNAFPALDPLRRLARCDAGSDAERFALVAARQASNRAEHAVLAAIELIGGRLPALEA